MSAGPGVRVKVASDLHFEFHRDGGATVAQELFDQGAGTFDVLVLAGDIADFKGYYRALQTLATARKQSSNVGVPIVAVLGNHEAYGGSWAAALGEARRAMADIESLHVLERSSCEIGGLTFAGCTLWYRYQGPSQIDGHMGDFRWIRDIQDMLLSVPQESRVFLERFLDRERSSGRPDVVVTHHLPSARSVPAQFKDSVLNRFFVNSQGRLLDEAGVLWCHGHTHEACDYVQGRTRVVCNPFGYAGHEHSTGFRSDFIVEVRNCLWNS